MTALKAKWTEINWYRRVLLIAMAVEILAFFVAVLAAVNRPGRGYQMERNGGFRRVVPSPAPARPSTSPGTNVRPSGIRLTPARPATWSGPSTPFNPPRPAGGHGRR